MLALTRAVPLSISRCELTHLPRVPIDVARARAQHSAYEGALASAGCAIVRLPAEPDLPDSVFVEDTAIVLDEIAVVTRPGAAARRGETVSVAAALQRYRPLRSIEPPGIIDGGDVLRVGRRLFVGRSSRTNASAIEQLRTLAAPFGYSVETIEPRGCLHLKSAATALNEQAVVINPEWVDRRCFDSLEAVPIDPREPFAANVLRVGATIICAQAAVRTRALLEKHGLTLLPVDLSELAKAEGALTCCSLIVSRSGPT